MNIRNNLCLILLGGFMYAAPVYALPLLSADNVTQEKKSDSEVKFNELRMFREKYKPAKPKATESELQKAQMALKMLMIQRTGEYTASGANAWGDKITLQHLRDAAKNIRALSYGVAKYGKSSMEDLNLYIDYLYTQGFFMNMPKFRYSSYDDVRKIPADFISALAVCDNDMRKARIIAATHKLLDYDVILQGDKAILDWLSSDYIFNVTPHLFHLAIANPDDAAAVNDLQVLSGFLRVATKYNVGNKDILKPDGTGFHHNTHYNGYMYSYRTWVVYFDRMKGTSFRIDMQSYNRLKKAVVSEYLMAVCSDSDKNRNYATSMAGRHPFYGTEVAFSKDLFEKLISIGGDVMGKEIDEELASYYNYFYKTNKYDVEAKDANGYYQFNYSPAGVYRQPGWVAVMRSPTTKFWGGELYNKTNRFGRYQSHGTLEIIYEGGLVNTGYPSVKDNKGGGWDWNMMPGSTTVHYTDWKKLMPNGNDADRFDQWAKTSNFAGALSMLDYGLFAAAFDQWDNWGNQRYVPTNLTYCKSVLAIDGMLFSVGNGISAKGEYDDDMLTATNLFQTIATEKFSKLIVNGKEVKKGTKMKISSDEAAYMVNPVSTGYFIPAGHDEITISYVEQTTPSSVGMGGKMITETAAKAYISHGVKPERKSYSFLVVPNTDNDKMKDISSRQTKDELFRIVEMRDSLHVIQYAPKNITAYTFFAPAKELNVGNVVSSATELLLMEEKTADGIKLGMANPNLRPKMLDKKNWRERPTPAFVVLKGTWEQVGNTKGVFVKSLEDGNTEISCLLKNGAPLYINLKKK